MEVNFKYYFLILTVVYCSAIFSEQYSADSTYIWYPETVKADTYFYQLQMLTSDHGYSMSSTKSDGSAAKLYEYINGQWYVIRTFPLSPPKNFILFRQKGELYLWTAACHVKSQQSIVSFYNGRNWLEQNIPLSPLEDKYSSPCVYIQGDNPQNIWLVGNKGSLFYYDDFNWKIVSTIIPDYFKKENIEISTIFVPNPTEIWAGSNQGHILHFKENKWEIDSADIYLKNNEIHDIYFKANKGWAVSANGYLLTYNNNRWRAKQLKPEWNLKSIKVFSDNNILIAGEEYGRGILIHLLNNHIVLYDFLQEENPGEIHDVDGFFFPAENRYKIWLAAENGIFTNTLKSGVSYSDATEKYNLPSSGRSGIFFDLDNDFDQDFILLSDGFSPYRIYLNDGFGGYYEYNLINEIKTGKNLSAAAIGDIDNDNKVDIIIINQQKKLTLWHQKRGLKFIAKNIDLVEIPENILVTLRFWDFNLDGYLDIFVTAGKEGLYCLLNNGYGQFEKKIQLNIPMQEDVNPVSITLYDVNVDGFTDIYLVYQSKDNQLWLNNGRGDFIKNDDPLYKKINGQNNIVSIFQDFNRDCWPDLYVYDGSVSGQIKLNKKLLTVTEPQTLNLPKGSHKFSVENGIVAVGDINHDYFPDLYVSDRIFVNNKGIYFNDLYSNKTMNLQWNPSFVDFDNDNDLDLFIAGKAEEQNDFKIYTALWQNNLEKRYAIKIKFNCMKNNRLGIGSWLWLYKTGGDDIARSEYCASKYIGFEGSPLTQESFLPITIPVDEDVYYSAIVRFPDGNTQTYNQIKPNQVYLINDLPLFQRWRFNLQRLTRLSLKQKILSLEMIKITILLLSLFWFLFKYKYVKKISRMIKTLLFLLVIFCYALYFFTESHSPYDISDCSFFIIFPIFLLILPLLIEFLIRLRHLEHIDHYKILKFLGEGGMGKVYKARNIKDNRIYAIKLLDSAVMIDEEGKKRFQLMERLKKEIKHPNVMRIIDTGIWKNQYYFIMEYLKGKTLRQLMNKKEQFSLKEILSISRQISFALKEIHKKNIVHRDVKPDNIFITEHNFIKLMDFDLARIGKKVSEVKNKILSGTLSYMSPQQAVGEPVDQRSDIYSLGVIMYELSSGRLPFLANRDMTIIYEKFKHNPIAICKLRKNFPSYFEKCIMKAMAKKAEERFKKIDELIAELDKIESILKKRKYHRIK